MSLGNYKAFLFDLDGTIWDSEEAFTETLKKVLEKALGKPVQKEIIRKKLRVDSPIGVMKSFNVFSFDRFWREYKGNYSLVRLFFDNTEIVFNRLLEKGAKLGIVTSLKKSISVDLLCRFNLSKLMSVIITPSETSARKPSPKPLLKALSFLRLNGDKAIYIGNSDIDIIAARGAGCCSGLVTWGARNPTAEKPDFTFHRIEDLLALCERD